MADERTRWREDRGRWESDDAPERHPGWHEREAWGREGRAREGYDYGREYWRQQDDYGNRAGYGGGGYDPYRGGSSYGERARWGASDWDRDRERGRYGGGSGSAYGSARYGREPGGYGWRERGYDPHRAAGHGHVGDEGYVGVPRGGLWRDDRDRYGERYATRSDYHPDERGWFDRAADEVSSWFGDDDAQRRREIDERRAGHHHGRGPRGYTRSDDRIREDVNDRLTDDAMVDASEIEVTVSKCEVTLNGTVDTRMAKRRAEDIAESVSGVRHVQNNIRVKEREGWSGTSASGTSSASTPSKSTVGQKT